MLVAKVIVPVPLDKTFDYIVGEKRAEVGSFVKVQFGKRSYTGLILELRNLTEESEYKLKEIADVLELEKIDTKTLQFLQWVSEYNIIPIGMVFKYLLPIGLLDLSSREIKTFKYSNDKVDNLTQKQKQLLDFFKENKDYYFSENDIKKNLNIGSSVVKTLLKYGLLEEKSEKVSSIDYNFNVNNVNLNTLTDEQNSVLNQINSHVDSNEKTILLQGETGSGKTEIYFHLIYNYLKNDNDNQTLFLIPEIALTSQLIDRFNKQFNSSIAIWHSDISNSKKRDIWLGVLNGNIKVVIGARSALFLPFKKLSLIIVDEEHDSSYKQVDNGCYNARDMAVLRAKINNIPIILGSATPSLESIINTENGKYKKVELKNRFGKAILPTIDIVDLKKEKNTILSKFLIEKMKEHLGNKNQVLLFLNRRGYSPIALCKECGHKFLCKNCSCALTNHKSKNKLICHQCGYSIDLINYCPSCNSKDSVIFYGVGVEKVEEEVKKIFPEKHIAIITSDTMLNINLMKSTLHDIEEKNIDIIIGTQIITKGYHFPDLTLVGVLDADAGLFGGQFKAIEYTYQSLTQVIGRAGRGEKVGEAVLQTYSPENIIIQALKNNDKCMILEFDKQNRELMEVPPFGKMAVLIVSHDKEYDLIKKIKEILRVFPVDSNLEILGPTQTIPYKLNNNFRYKIIVKTKNNINIQKLIKTVLEKVNLNSVKIKIDINPYNIP